VTDRLPPHDIEAEKAMLGACMLDPVDALAQAIARNAGDLCYDQRHGELFGHFVTLSESGAPWDMIALSKHLTDSGRMTAIGGWQYVSALPESAAGATNIDYYLKVLEEKHYARQVIKASVELQRMAYENSGQLSEFADEVETRIFALRRGYGVKKGARKDSFARVIDAIQAAHEGHKVAGLPTGFYDLDKMLGGLRPKMYVVAARPGMGKSSLVMNIAEYVAINLKTAVGVFNLEMPEDELNARSLGSYSHINMQEVMSGNITRGDIDKLIGGVRVLSPAPIHIIDRSDIRIHQLRAEARRLVSREKCGLIIVDYLQLVSGSRRFENRAQEVGEVSRGIKAMVNELKVPVIAVAAINRDVEKEDRRPRLSDLRECGSIEFDADVIAFLHSTEPDADRLPIKCAISKHRGGRCGEIDLLFNKPITRFENASRICNND